MPAELVDALGRLPLPLGVTTGPDHLVELLTPSARTLLPAALVVGRPVRESVPEGDPLLTALDRAHRTREPGHTGPDAAVAVGCVPVHGADGTVVGVLLHVGQDGDDPAVRALRADARSSALQQLAGRLSQAGTPAAVGRLAVSAAVRVLDADAAGVYTYAEPDVLQVLHASGWSAEATRRYEQVPIRRGRPLSDAVLTGVPVYLEDAEQWRRRYPETAPAGTAEGFQASACLPLRVEDRDLGAAVFTFATARNFSASERDHLEAVAALCAQALDRVRLLGAEQVARAAAEQQLARMTFLADAANLMETPLSVEQRLQHLADLAVPGVADWCAVHLVRDGQVDRIAVAHTDPSKVEFVARLQDQYPPDPDAPNGAIHVSRSGESVFLPEIPDELITAAAADQTHLELLRSIGMRSAVAVPLLVRGRSLGALTLVHAESGRRFTETDLAFCRQLAATAAVALDNARLYEQQRDIARTLQSALLPARLPRIPGLTLAARYQAQNADRSVVYVGGDLYDVVEGTTPGRWAVTVADVCGKGTEAAALTALIRHTVRAEVGHGLGPADVLRRLNTAMLRAPGPEPARFATVVHGQVHVDDAGATVRLAGAGHLPPLVLRGRGVRAQRVDTVDTGGTVLGVYAEVAPTETEIRLDRGDVLMLYTDGVTEARGVDGFYGAERLTGVLGSCADRSAEAVADAVLTDVTLFQQGALRDDIAILVVGVPAGAVSS